MERVRSWLGDEDWKSLSQAAHFARANLAKVVGRVPGALGNLLDVVGDLGLEDAGNLGAAIAKVASLLEEGDLPALDDTIGDILEAGQLLSTLSSVFYPHTSKKQKNWRRLFVIPEKLAEKVRKSQRQDFATKVR